MLVRTFTGHSGPVNAVAFSADGTILAAAGGEPGVGGELRPWNGADGALLRTFKDAGDAIYSLALAPDGRGFSTGGYDPPILLWGRDPDRPVPEVHGHNEGVVGPPF